MLRAFSTHRIRPIEELEGLWEFEPLGADGGIPDHYRYRLPVPGVWEMHPAFLTYRGRGAYRRTVVIRRAGPIRLTFYGVSHTADVYWDGHRVGHHYDAHTAFAIVVPLAASGPHELVVVADNRFTAASTLHVPNDYYTYGGIPRPVAISPVPSTHLEAVRFTPSRQGSTWWGAIRVGVRAIGGPRDPIVTVDLAGTRVELRRESTDGEVAWYGGLAAFPEARAWSPDQPHLYPLTAELRWRAEEDAFDDLVERVGFRTVTVERGGLRINGDPVILKGFNRHEDYPGVGSALPFPLMVQDLDLLRDLGANAVRTAHYPNDARFLDLCDEMGLMVWEEHHARGFDLAQMTRPGFREQISAATAEMVSQHQTHPAIVVWGL